MELNSTPTPILRPLEVRVRTTVEESARKLHERLASGGKEAQERVAENIHRDK
jgi:hypothetical protein